MIGFLIAPVFNKLMHFFPPVVTGTVITVIGVSLLPVAIRWAGGGQANDPNFGSLSNVALAAVTLLIILLIYRFLPGFMSRIAILAGLFLGTFVAIPFGKVNFSWVGSPPTHRPPASCPSTTCRAASTPRARRPGPFRSGIRNPLQGVDERATSLYCFCGNKVPPGETASDRPRLTLASVASHGRQR